jgi:predicted nuclease with RNAse H fold
MRTVNHLIGTSALALAGMAAQASEFTPLLSVSQATWPGKNRIGVVCKYADSQKEIQALREAASEDATITVVDARSESQPGQVRGILLQRKVDYLVLMPTGRVFREGTVGSTVLVRSLANAGVPSIGTTPRAIAQGAVFAVGEKTGWNLLVSDRPVGTISVVLPQKGQVFMGGGGAGLATLEVVGLAE